MIVKVYKYAAEEPSNLGTIQDQLRRGNRLRNDLIAIELEKRTRTDQLLHNSNSEIAELESDIAAIELQIEQATDAVKKQNQENRKRTKASPEQAAALKQLRQQRSELKKTLREAKKTLRAALDGETKADPELAEMQALYARMSDRESPDFRGPNHGDRLRLKAAIEARTRQVLTGLAAEVYTTKMEAIERSKAAEEASGLYVYHKTAIRDDVSRACKTQPRFRRYDGCGRLYVQIKNKPTSTVGDKGLLRLEGVGRHRTAHLRIDKSGLETAIPILYHRPLPDANIVGVRLVKYRIATHAYWEVQIECKMQEHILDRAINDAYAAVDLGWRKTDEGIKVAHWLGDDTDGGGEGELIIPWKMVSRWQQIDDLQSIRDTAFGAVRDLLHNWLRTHTVPEWLREETKSLHQWRSQRRLAGLLRRWQRFDGDEAIYSYLNGPQVQRFVNDKWRQTGSGWRNWDRHLYEWQEQLRAKALRWRDDFYRKFAARLSRRYGVFRLENIDWRQITRKANAEDESNDAIRRFQRIAAPGRLAAILMQRASRWQRVEARGTTSTCNDCGQPIQFGAIRRMTCACGAQHDRDQNACYNILMSNKVEKSGCNQSSAAVAQETPTTLERDAA